MAVEPPRESVVVVVVVEVLMSAEYKLIVGEAPSFTAPSHNWTKATETMITINGHTNSHSCIIQTPKKYAAENTKTI